MPFIRPAPAPRLLSAATRFFTALFLLIRFLTGNIYGLGLLAGLAYLLLPHASWTQVLDWLMSRSEAMQTSIATGLLTVVGFFIAFASGSDAARREARNNLRLAAGTDFFQCLSGALTELNKLRLLATDLRQTSQALKAGKHVDPNAIAFLAERCRASQPTRTSLVSRPDELETLRFKHHGVLNAHIGGFAIVDLAQRVITDAISVWNYPIANWRLPVDEATQQLQATPLREWDPFIEATEAAAESLKPVLKLTLTIPAAAAFGFNFVSLVNGFRKDA